MLEITLFYLLCLVILSRYFKIIPKNKIGILNNSYGGKDNYSIPANKWAYFDVKSMDAVADMFIEMGERRVNKVNRNK